MGRRWAIRTLNFKEVSYENGNFHNHCSDNLEPNSKDNSEYAVLCSLLRGSPDFFFLALHCNAFSYHNFEIERSQYCKWYVSQNCKQLFLFSKSKLQLLETVFRLHFSKISFQPSCPSCCGFCRLTPNGCTFEFPMGTSYEYTERGEAASRSALGRVWVQEIQVGETYQSRAPPRARSTSITAHIHHSSECYETNYQLQITVSF